MNVTPQTKVAVGCFMYSIYTNMSLQGFGHFSSNIQKNTSNILSSNVFVIIASIIWIIDKAIRNFVNLHGKLSAFRDVHDDVNEIWVNRKLYLMRR